MKVFIGVLLILIYFEVGNRLCFKKLAGVVALKRDKRTIVTTLSIVTIIRYLLKGSEKEFIRDCRRFSKSLDKNRQYYTHTHETILKRIKKLCGEGNVLATETKMKKMMLSKLFIGYKKELFETRQYYDVTFIIK